MPCRATQLCQSRCCAAADWLEVKLSSLVAALPPPPKTTRALQQRRVVVWQGVRNELGRLAFMYWPVMSTLFTGFRDAGVDIRAGVGMTAERSSAIARLRQGDGFIWVGINGRFAQPWEDLRRRGVRLAYYQTEPIHRGRGPCDRYNHTVGMVRKVDEIWDFSHHNLDLCGGTLDPRDRRPLVVRYVPPGYIPTVPRLDGRSSALLFFGSISRTARRGPCYYQLKHELREQLQQTYSVWNESALAAVLGRYDIYLNVHKNCASGGPVTFRNALLLSAGKLILSDRAHPRDEAEFAGMVQFVPLADIGAAYRRLRTHDVRAERQRAHALFQERFQPRDIFQRAGIYRDWLT